MRPCGSTRCRTAIAWRVNIRPVPEILILRIGLFSFHPKGLKSLVGDPKDVYMMTEITVRIAKRIMLARLSTIVTILDGNYEELSNSETQEIWDEIQALHLSVCRK